MNDSYPQLRYLILLPASYDEDSEDDPARAARLLRYAGHHLPGSPAVCVPFHGRLQLHGRDGGGEGHGRRARAVPARAAGARSGPRGIDAVAPASGHAPGTRAEDPAHPPVGHPSATAVTGRSALLADAPERR